jgi:CheY-like chemotaxis protein/anti-sigma regulatory factor (Ser/Thr protein kinase)
MVMSQSNNPAGEMPSSSPPSANPGSTSILVVDDGVVDRRLASGLVQKRLGWKVMVAGNGAEALALLAKETPAVVLTDMQMPEMDGLELVEAVRSQYPHVPVVLMTAHGSEDLAIRALHAGAASYVPKKSLARDLAETLQQVVAATRTDRRQKRLLECVTRMETDFTLENDPALMPALVGHVKDYLCRLRFCDPNMQTRVGIALEEALLNGLYHGNLELSSDLRQQGDGQEYYRLAEERRGLAPYRERRLSVEVRMSPAQATFVVRDEGPGFDPTTLPDPTDPANLEKTTGRGLLLIRAFMDEVQHNAAGNEITLVKRRQGTL